LLSEEKYIFLSDKPRMRSFFHFLLTGKMAASQTVLEWTKQVAVRSSHIWIIRRMLQHLKVQLVEALNGVDGNVRTGVIVQRCGTLRHLIRIADFGSLRSISL
jgi:hypothetical protein